MTARPYKTIRNSDRVKLEVRDWGPDRAYDIYARPEQLEPYFVRKHGFFAVHTLLAHLDTYRSLGYVARIPLDNVRVVKISMPVPPEPLETVLEAIVHRLNAMRKAEQEKRRNKPKVIGWSAPRLREP